MIFFLVGSAGAPGVVGDLGLTTSGASAAVSFKDDSICAAIVGFGLTGSGHRTGPAGGVSRTGASMESDCVETSDGLMMGASAAGVAAVTVGEASSPAMMLCAKEAASSSSLSGVSRASTTAAGGLSWSFPATRFRRSPSAAQQPAS